MPIYEYVCNNCGHEFEKWQKITDSPVRKCPSCGKLKVERLVSLSAFHLKGSGWYVTDYGGKKSDGAAKKANSEDKTEGKTDKKDTPTKNKSDKSDKTKTDSKSSSP